MQNNTIINKIIIVAGASGGIGGSVVKELSNLCANVIAVYNQTHPDFKVDRNISLIKADLSKSEEWERVLDFVSQKYKKLDVLINCAGILIPGDFLIQSEEQINKMINVNLSSVLIGTQKSLKLMKRQKFGHIINIGSIGGIIPMPYSSVYSATKFALRGFTHSLSQELKGSEVKISLISPGPVNTKMLKLEADHYKTAIAFISKTIESEVVADIVLKVINKHKAEVIVPSLLSIPSKVAFLFPGLFSKAYSLIEKIGLWRKKFYIRRKFGLSLQK
ncbi:MAG: SDR family NAD(P)-dependent oxidoreductase [Ignavibacteria bacterium]|nr:SDR family NAD(P)-dependent oxidoreductase [Ignavibacteria bacterium]MBT8381179.1 SDR family NAD(P)-dependent oxidoreductase [Ignavibacteria bacterium]NNJ52880.1 SDR family NAD(P)-dependent oxidoreductase [Ignavibacteriaceae bacterium]